MRREQGELRIEKNGKIIEARTLGKSSIIGYPNSDGSLAVAWCDDTLFFFKGSEVISIMDYPEPPAEMISLDNNLLIWDRKELQIIDRNGHKQWDVDFSKCLDKVEIYEDKIVCAAVVLAIFNCNK